MSPSRFWRRARALFPFLSLTSVPGLAVAAEELAFDTWNGAGSSSIRPDGDSPGSQITIGAAVTISSIAARVDLDSDGSLKFVIFAHPSHEVVHISEPQSFVDDGMTWKKSNTLDVVLPPGTYDIGAIANVSGAWAYDSTGAVAGDYSSTSGNPNFITYNSPAAGEHALADGAVRLYARIPECGDGFVDVNEECDDADADNTDDCLDTCVAASCGDGYVGPGEGCDDGNDVDDDACTNECVSATCGDGSVQLDEECDDGNATDDDDCTNACTLPACGDGIVQKDEECDDGNRKAGDGCARDCSVEQEDGGGGEGGSGESAGGEGGAGERGADAVDDGRESSGCSCRLEKHEGAQGLWALLGLGVLAGARRRKR